MSTRAWVGGAAGLWMCAAGLGLPLAAQRGGMFQGSTDDPAIAYATAPVDNRVEALNRRLVDGSAVLRFEGRSGYLQSALDLLRLPVDSQLLVFSKASLQGRLIGPTSPRAIFFDDRLMLAWVRDAELLEVAVHDARVGVAFYTVEQKPAERPVFKRELRCLGCHLTGDTLGVPGLLMFSTRPETVDRSMRIAAIDHRNALAERWGGWFVTGSRSNLGHLGNRVPALDGREGDALPSVAGLFDADGFRAASSDVAALLTLSHQTHMTNLLTRAAWEARAADPALHPGTPSTPERARSIAQLMDGVAAEVVDYLLFVDEAPLSTPLAGPSAFAARFSAGGPRDRRGRSLYELDLTRRLMQYPCSYLIYSPAFDALPALVKEPIYRRLWQVLSGDAREPRYRSLSLADRRAIVEILQDTKADLPTYFAAVSR
jgi:hypothetical protein